MKKFILFLSFAVCSLIMRAQAPQAHKVVHLKNGTVIKGSLTTSDSLGYITVLDWQNEIHYYDTSMVAQVEDGIMYRRHYDLRPKGYICDIEMGGSYIMPTKAAAGSVPGFSLDVINSYQFSPYASLGLGVGTQLAASGHNIEMLSVYADTRLYFIKSNVGPFLDIAAGYTAMFMKYTDYDSFNLNLPTVKEMDNGVMFNPSLGIRVSLGREVAMTVDMGYKLNYLHTPDDVYYLVSGDATFMPDTRGFYLFHAITLRAGFQF